MNKINQRHLSEFLLESNKIESVFGVSIDEIDKAIIFLLKPTLPNLQEYVRATAGNYAVLRTSPTQNVRIGYQIPPEGGPHIQEEVENILERAITLSESIWKVHCDYEMLHPFLDGNGRSGRLIWLYMYCRVYSDLPEMPFLQKFYYQTLSAYRK